LLHDQISSLFSKFAIHLEVLVQLTVWESLCTLMWRSNPKGGA
jgi:hypothetical protein